MRTVFPIVTAIICWFCCVDESIAGVIYQSGTLGTTAITREEVTSGIVPASNIASFYYVGVRFEVTSAWITSQIGGHFLGGFAETSFFGALVSLTSADDFPNSGNLATPDVLGEVSMSFPPTSTISTGNLAVRLDPGWYALVFGTSLFGSEGRGSAMRNGKDIESPSYILWHPDPGWFNYSDTSYILGPGNMHLFVEGNAIPEPTTGAILTIAALALTAPVGTRRRVVRIPCF